MKLKTPDCYDDFVGNLLIAGFSMGSGNTDGIFTAVPINWNDRPDDSSRVRWFTGDPDTDPWEWRLRVLSDRVDIAYGKMFFRKGGYITKEWYPFFLAARREGMEFEDEYESGAMSSYAKRIYGFVRERGAAPIETIRKLGGFSRQDKSKVESALIELQMRLYLTICGVYRKISKEGFEYGWTANVYGTTESFWGGEVFDAAAGLSSGEARDALEERIYALNPAADASKIDKFIYGR
jgi:hypothetical protein